jgi:hypothetical protein
MARTMRPPKPAVLPDHDTWPQPDMSVLRLGRHRPPPLPLTVFGPAWEAWIVSAAAAASCPADYVAAPLLASISTLIGHSRWAQATPGWIEPPHLWVAAVGDSGTGKSPGADCLMRDVLPEIERRMLADFPDRLQEWASTAERGKAATLRWRRELREAEQCGAPPPPSPRVFAAAEPQAPRLRQHDVTIEKVAELLDAAAPKGLLIVRDELAGWIAGMNAYHGGGREFWIEAYGGRPYRVERKTNPHPLIVSRLAVGVYGGTQPDKLALLLREADDGLLGRLLWAWPEPIRFRLGHEAPRTTWATRALDRLRELDLRPGDPPMPIMVPLTKEARAMIETFANEMQDWQSTACGPLRSAIGKARGAALRISLVLELMWWCGEEGTRPPPAEIGAEAFAAAARLIGDYFMAMAERVYGDAAASERDRAAARLARWIIRTHPSEVHVRHLQRDVRLQGLRTAEHIRAAAGMLVEAGWLREPVPGNEFGQRGRVAYTVNPRLQAG